MGVSKTVTAVGLLLFAVAPYASAQGARVAGEILVSFAPGADGAARANAHRQAQGTVRNEIASTGVQLVGVAAGDESAAIARYRNNPNVLSAEPNFLRSIRDPVSHDPGSEIVAGDFYFGEQYGLQNTGQMFYCIPGLFCLYIATADADIDAPEAWAISTGSADLIEVAVIDSGVDYNHPDLAVNYAGGRDFVDNDGDPMDEHGHGTHVAGTIAAALNNLTGQPGSEAEEGVVGVAPNARIRAYKVCRVDGSCDDFAIQQAMARAFADGSDVINMSLGSTDFSQSLCNAVQTAWADGLVIVAGAGNDGTTEAFYPASCPNVISVAAVDEDHRRPPFSNYGDHVDLSAPGNVIMSTYPLAACGGATTVPGDTGCYTWRSGTSMATPHVSGAVALVLSRPDVNSNSEVVDVLLNSADPKGVDSNGVRLDSWTRHGGLNLHDALIYGLTNIPPVAEAGPDQIVTDTRKKGEERVIVDGSGSSDADGSIVGYEWRDELDALIGYAASESVWLTVGVHTLTLTVTDDFGATHTDNVVVEVTTADTGGGGGGVACGNELTLTATGRKVKGLQTVDLAWCGTSGAQPVTVYRDNVPIATVDDEGVYTDNIDLRGGGSYTYEVCEGGFCLPNATVSF